MSDAVCGQDSTQHQCESPRETPGESIDPPGGPSTQESRSNSGLSCAEPSTACLILGRTELEPRVCTASELRSLPETLAQVATELTSSWKPSANKKCPRKRKLVPKKL
eukprot:6187651-Pleurochrysis_carterae.AAC.2